MVETRRVSSQDAKREMIKRFLSKFYKVFLTTKVLEDGIVVVGKEPYIYWNFHTLVKNPKMKRVLKWMDEKVCLLLALYSLTHEDEESNGDFTENEEEVDCHPDFDEMEDENVEDLTPLEELFEEIVNREEAGFSRWEENHPIEEENPIFYEIWEGEDYPYENTEGEILGGIWTPLEENDYREHSKTFRTFTEEWLTCVFLIPVGCWTTSHEMVLFFQLVLVYVFYQETWQSLKQVKDYEKDDYDEIGERLSEMEKPTRNFLFSLLTRSYLFIYETLVLRVGILGISVIFLPPLMLPVFADLKDFWKRNKYQDHLTMRLLDLWQDTHEGHGWLWILIGIVVLWTLIFLPSMPFAIESAYYDDEDTFETQYGESWKKGYNLVSNPHPEYPNPLSRQEKLEAPITVDPDWLKMECEEETWLIWLGALHVYLLENRSSWKEWIQTIQKVRGKSGESRPKEDQRFDWSQFSTQGAGINFWCLSEPILGYAKQEETQKWGSWWLRDREIELYKKVKEGIFRWKRGERAHPGLPTKEENLKWRRGVYGTFQEKLELEKGKKKNRSESFYQDFWSSVKETEEEVDAFGLLPNLDRYLYWSVQRGEQIKRRRKERKKGRVSFGLPIFFSKLFFYLGGKLVVPMIFLGLKILSTFSLWIYLLRDLSFPLGKDRIVRFVWMYLLAPIIFQICHTLEKRFRGVLGGCQMLFSLGMWLFRGRPFAEVWEEEEDGFLWWLGEIQQTYFSDWIGKKRKPKVELELIDQVEDWVNYGKSSNGVGSREKTHPLSYYGWFHSWYRREHKGLIEYIHGISRREEEKFVYNREESYYEDKYERIYGKHRNCDVEMSMQKKAKGLLEAHGLRRSLFRIPEKGGETPKGSEGVSKVGEESSTK